jgi:hypothetical protein
LFAIALLASGQNSSITGTLAGQMVMEGFVHIKVAPWLRRLITRSLAIIPTIIVVAITGERGTEKLLLLSQVILSLQLSFRSGPAGDVHRQPQEDGRVRERPLAAGAVVVCGRADCRAECMVPGADAQGRGASECCRDCDQCGYKGQRAGVTSADGRFLFSQVNPGTYTVTVRANGFAAADVAAG